MHPSQLHLSDLHCTVYGQVESQSLAAAAIIEKCAEDIGQQVFVSTSPDSAALETTITFELSAEQASGQDQVWCLACRVACFCPDARVSVLIRGEDSFAQRSDGLADIRIA